MIARQTIDQIFNTATVEDVIGEFVQLKRSGSNLKGLSPFADEKTPSFMVSPAKQIWKDFSTGKGGNVVTFLMEHEQFSYPEALRWLAKKYNIEIEEDREQTDEEKEQLKSRESLFLLTEFANKYFVEQLHNTEEGKNIGLSYFKERGFTPQTIQKFQLGYSPKKWEAFAEYAQQKGFAKKLLEASGLVTFKENKTYDRFRERVIFPIHSFSGRTLGFGARILRNDVKAAKYLNSPENEIYHKSKILYGISQAKQSILKNNECFLVEGYTDVLSLHQSGIENVVASSGTALTQEQIRLIKRLTPNITLLYDGDSAGIKASFRGIDLILEQELNVKVLLFPEGEDPDSFAQKHSAVEIQDYINKNATDFIKFKANVLLDEAQGDPAKKSALIREIIQSIALIPNMIQRELYVQETASLMGIREDVLFKELSQILRKKQIDEKKSIQHKPQTMHVVNKEDKIVVDPLGVVEEELIKLMMQYGDLSIEIKNGNESFTTTVIEEIVNQFNENDLMFKNEAYQALFEQIKVGYEEADELRTGSFFIKMMNEEQSNIASEAMVEKYTISKNWAEKQGIYIKSKEMNVGKDVTDTILRYKSFYVDQMIKDLSRLLQDEDITHEVRHEQMEKVMKLTQVRAKIYRALNRVI